MVPLRLDTNSKRSLTCSRASLRMQHLCYRLPPHPVSPCLAVAACSNAAPSWWQRLAFAGPRGVSEKLFRRRPSRADCCERAARPSPFSIAPGASQHTVHSAGIGVQRKLCYRRFSRSRHNLMRAAPRDPSRFPPSPSLLRERTRKYESHGRSTSARPRLAPTHGA